MPLESWKVDPIACIKLARADGLLLGRESSAAVLIDALRLCTSVDLERTRMVAHALDTSSGQSCIPGLRPEEDEAAAPLEAARSREPSFAALLERLRLLDAEGERKLGALKVRHDRLRAAARIASRDWAACARDGGRLWMIPKGRALLLRVVCPGVLEVTDADSARLIARSLPGQLAELDPAHDPE